MNYLLLYFTQSDKLVTLRGVVITQDVYKTTMDFFTNLENTPVKELSIIVMGLLAILGIGYYINVIRKKHAEYYLETPPFSKDTLRKIALAKGDDVGPLRFSEEAEEAQKWFKYIEQSDPGKLKEYNHAYCLHNEIGVYLKSKWQQRYELLLERGLHKLSVSVFKEASTSHSQQGLTSFFTNESFGFCLLLAFVYPVVFVLISLPISLQLQIGQLTLIESVSDIKAWVLLPATLLLIFSFKRFWNLNSWHKLFCTAVLIFVLNIDVAIALASAFIVGSAVMTAAYAGPIVTISIAGAAVVGAIVGVVIEGFFGNIAGISLASAAFCAFGVVIFRLSFVMLDRSIFDEISFSTDFGIANYTQWLVTVFFCTLTIISISNTESKSLIFIPLMLLILPLLNAPVDWLSLNITRWLISKMQQHHHNMFMVIAYGIADLILAVGFVFVLSAALLLVIIGVNHLGNVLSGQLLIDFRILMPELEDSPAKHTWIHLMVISTLIPTLLHFILVLYSFASWPVAHWGKEAYQRLHNHTSEQNGTFIQDRSKIMLASRFRWGLTLVFVTAIVFLLSWLSGWIYPIASWLWHWADLILWLDPLYKTSL